MLLLKIIAPWNIITLAIIMMTQSKPALSMRINFDTLKTISESVESLFIQLKQCHLQVYLDPHSELEQFQTLHTILNYFQDKGVTYAIQRNINLTIYLADKSWAKVKHNFLQRSKCFAHVFLEGRFWSHQRPHLQVTLQQESWPVNPDYVIFLTEKSSFSFTIDLFHTVAPSHYLGFCYAILRMLQVYSINQALSTVAYSSRIYELPVEIRKYFKHVNMNHKFISSDLSDYEKQRNLKTCDYSTEFGVHNRPPTVEECIFKELSKSMNFTYRHGGGGYAFVRRRQSLSLDYLNNDIKPNRRQIVEHGLVFDQWGYLVGKEKLSVYDTGLIGPFDLLTWAGIVSSVLGLSILFVITTASKTLLMPPMSPVTRVLFHYEHAPFHPVEKSSRILTYVIGSLLDQSVISSMSRLRLWGNFNKSLTMLWMFWAFSAFLLGQLYKGKMFSFLTKAPEPGYPNTLTNLALSDIMIATFTAMWHRDGVNSIILSYLKEVMTSGDIHYPNYYEDFNHSLKYIPAWLNGLRRFSADLYLQEHRHLLPNGTIDFEEIPASFASFDYLKHVHMHKKVLSLFSPKKWLSPVQTVDSYMSTMPWTVNKNYFYPLFKRGLSQIYESGLYNRWDGYHDSINGLDNFYWVEHLIKEKGVNSSSIHTSVSKWKWHNYYFYKETNSKNEHVFEPVTIKVLNVIWILSAILLSLSVALCFVEIITNKSLERRNQVKVLF